MGIRNADYTDIVNKDFQSLKLSVGTTEVLAATNGGVALADRERLVIINLGNKDIYIGPTGVSANGANQGDVLRPDERYIFDRVGPEINVYMIVQAGTADVIVWEFS